MSLIQPLRGMIRMRRNWEVIIFGILRVPWEKWKETAGQGRGTVESGAVHRLGGEGKPDV